LDGLEIVLQRYFYHFLKSNHQLLQSFLNDWGLVLPCYCHIFCTNGSTTEAETYTSIKSFKETFHGFRFTNPKMGIMFRAAKLIEHHVDPTVIYIAKHPFLTVHLEEFSHTQITDKAFEDKACMVLEQHHFSPIPCSTVSLNNPLNVAAGAALQEQMVILLSGKEFGKALKDTFFS